jgi:glycosyltransferase involved in cell wall biosynthesis
MTHARVVVVSTFYFPIIGGAESAARRLAAFLKRQGRDVFVLTKRTSSDHHAAEIIDDVPVYRRPPTGPRSGMAKWWFAPVVFLDLIRRRAEYDAICVVDQRGVGLAALAAGRLLGRAVVFQPQTEGTIGSAHPMRSGVRGTVRAFVSHPIRWLYGRADAIACITKSIVAEGREMGVPEARLPYVPNPVDTRRFVPVTPDVKAALRAEHGFDQDAVIFTVTGRLSREKGTREVLTAWREVARPGRVLVMIGPGMPGHPWDESAWARAFIEREGLQASVQLVGSKTPPEVATLLAAADVAVLPSHFEAHPLAAVEAMATGLPIVASRVGGVPDFVVPEVNGLMVPARDVPALAAAMNRLATSPDLRAAWGRAARSAAEMFDEAVVLGRFGDLIDQKAAARRPAHAR